MLALATQSPAAVDSDAAGLYRERCASCHEGGVTRAPDVASLKQMSAATIKFALTGGSMRTQGESLSAAEIDAVSRFLGRAGCSPAQSAAVTAIPGVVFSGGLDGHLRGYDAADGRIMWDVDTRGTYETVNGMTARGGSIDGPGPVVVDGMLYVNSGYAVFGGMPGNVLLAFSADGV